MLRAIFVCFMFAYVQGGVIINDDFYELGRGVNDDFEPDRRVNDELYENDRRVNDDSYEINRGVNDELYENDRGVNDDFYDNDKAVNEDIYNYLFGLDRAVSDDDLYGVDREVKRTQGEFKEYYSYYGCDANSLSKSCHRHVDCTCGCKGNGGKNYNVDETFTKGTTGTTCTLCQCKTSKASSNKPYSLCQQHNCPILPAPSCKKIITPSDTCCPKCGDSNPPPPPPPVGGGGFVFPNSPHASGGHAGGGVPNGYGGVGPGDERVLEFNDDGVLSHEKDEDDLAEELKITEK